MQLTRKTYQRIDATGRWLGPIELMPEIVANDDGTLEIGFRPASDLVDANPPDNPNQIWVDGGWSFPIVPDRPDSIMRRRIDNDGFWVRDEILNPIWHENRWVFLGIDDPLLIATQIDQTRPWYKPRWDGMEWVESLTPQQIEIVHPHVVDWVQFLKDFTETDLDEVIWKTKNKRALRLFDRAIVAANPDPATIWKYWNACAESVVVPLEQLQGLIDKHKAPIEVDELGMVKYGV